MKVANLVLLSACLAVAGCSASNTAASNQSTPQPTNAKAAVANSNAANLAV